MILEIIVFVLLGVLSGLITGLMPGIHINLVSVFLVFLSFKFSSFLEPIYFVVFVVSMAITHTFVDFIPSIFLGSPDEDSALSVLPGHELLNKGRGFEAFVYTVYGGIIGLLLIVIFTPLFVFFLPGIMPYINNVMFIILLSSPIYLLFRDRNHFPSSLFIFVIAGFLGIASLSDSLSISQPLLPLLSGLFGASSLITSITKSNNIPKQIIKPIKEIKFSFSNFKEVFIGSLFSAPLCSFLPGLGSSQAAVISTDIMGDSNKKVFLSMLGSINTLVMGLSFIALYSIDKTRTGAAVAVKEIIPSLSINHLVIIVFSILLSGVLASVISVFIARFFSRFISRVNYRLLSVIILIFLSIIVLLFSGLLGLFVFLISAFVGLSAIMLNVRRSLLMACIMIPSIIWYIP